MSWTNCNDNRQENLVVWGLVSRDNEICQMDHRFSVYGLQKSSTGEKQFKA